MPAEGRRASAEAVLGVIRSRRVTRFFDERPVAADDLLAVLEAGRWATSGGGRRIHPFLVVRDPVTLAQLRAVAPGMFSTPAVAIVICTDSGRAVEELIQLEHDRTTMIDVGTAAMNMMVAVQALGLGACPVTSFSQAAVGVILGLPPTVEAELILLVGHPVRPHGWTDQARGVAHGPTDLPADLVWWERPGRATPDPSAPAAVDAAAVDAAAATGDAGNTTHGEA